MKADSENRPGPHSYGRDHAEGANMLAAALKPYGGKVIWRRFVYNCHVDWRDRASDRAKAAYDCFKPLDGKFSDNAYIQIKNGPMDFQIREAVSPLFGAMPHTNCLCEFQIAQEYTGQQIDLTPTETVWVQTGQKPRERDIQHNMLHIMKRCMKTLTPVPGNCSCFSIIFLIPICLKAERL